MEEHARNAFPNSIRRPSKGTNVASGTIIMTEIVTVTQKEPRDECQIPNPTRGLPGL